MTQPNRLPLLLAFLTLLMGGLALFFFVRLKQIRQELALTRQQVLARDRVIFRQEGALRRAEDNAAAQAVNTDTVKVEPPAAAVFADELGSLTGDELSGLMKAGLPADPEAYLREDLMKKAPSLHTTDAAAPLAVFEDVRILTPHFALASWHDERSGGAAVLRYDVRGPGKVAWRVLDWGVRDVQP